MSELLEPADIAKILKVSERSVIALAKHDDDKRLPGLKVANEWRFRAEDVQKYIDRQIGEKGSPE